MNLAEVEVEEKVGVKLCERLGLGFVRFYIYHNKEQRIVSHFLSVVFKQFPHSHQTVNQLFNLINTLFMDIIVLAQYI